MKVKAIRLSNSRGEEVLSSPWITLGREYVVLGIYTYAKGPFAGPMVRLIPDEGGRMPTLFSLADFQISDSRPSGLWRVGFDGNELAIEPEAWQLPNFWAVFFGDMPDLLVVGQQSPIPDLTERFDVAVRAMMDEAGMNWVGDPDEGPAGG